MPSSSPTLFLMGLITWMSTCPRLPSGSSFVKPRQGPISGRDALARRSGSRRRASESSGSARRALERRSGTGTRVTVPVRLTSLLCLLSEELHRQPRAVYKCWVPRRCWFLSTAPRIWQSPVRCSGWFDIGFRRWLLGAFRIQRNACFDSCSGR